MGLDEKSDGLSSVLDPELEELLESLSEPLITLNLTPEMKAYVRGYRDALSAILRTISNLEGGLPKVDD